MRDLIIRWLCMYVLALLHLCLNIMCAGTFACMSVHNGKYFCLGWENELSSAVTKMKQAEMKYVCVCMCLHVCVHYRCVYIYIYIYIFFFFFMSCFCQTSKESTMI